MKKLKKNIKDPDPRPVKTRNKIPLIQIAVVLLFFISGGTGLVYEVTWTRLFTSVFGNTTYAVSAVLTAFMGGLALGSLVIGKIADKRQNLLKLVAYLEAGVAIFAVLLPWILDLLTIVYKMVYQTFPDYVWLLLIIKTIFSFITLLIPTFLMGGTLPALSKLLVKDADQSGLKVSVLYALNTLGAMTGCFFTGFFLIEHFGVVNTIYITALINSGLAVLFFSLAGFERIKIKKASDIESESFLPEESPDDKRLQKIILYSFAIAGFAALSFEVLWTRLLVFKLNTTVYAFSIMLTTFLSGIGIGSILVWITEKWNLIKNHIRVFAILELLIGIYGLFSILIFSQFETLSAAWMPVFWREQMIQQLVLAGMIMLFPTILMGMAFPIVCRIYAKDINKIGTSIGKVYAVNTLGSILGSFITGFLLVQILGTQLSVVIISLLVIMVGSVVIWHSSPRKKKTKSNKLILAFTGLIWVIACGFIVSTPSDLLFQYFNIGEKLVNQRVEILYANEGIECVTTVHRYPDGNRVISTGSINVAGTDFTLRTTQKLQAHIPMLLHPSPKKVLQVGFGSGETSHILTTYDTDEVDIVEISQGVLETSTKFFKDLNFEVVYHPKFSAIIMDGANYIALSDRKYDVIMNDSIWPFYAGNSGLYTKEYFEDGKNRLNDGGIMTSWLPVELPEESFRSLLKTFCSVFPHVSLWMAVTHYNKHALLVGSLQPLKIDLDVFLDRFRKYAQNDLAGVSLKNPLYLLDAFKMDETTLNKLLAGAEIHTLDKPVLEFAQRKKRPGIDRERAYELIAGGIRPVTSHLVSTKMDESEFTMIKDSLNQIYLATRYLMNGLIKREKGQANYLEDFGMAQKYQSDHPGIIYLYDEMNKLNMMSNADIKGTDFNRLLALGERFLENNIHDKAKLAFNRALEIYPATSIVHYNLGTVHYREGDLDAALKSLNTAIDLKPIYAPAFNLRGLLFNAKKNTTRATSNFTRAIELDPDNAYAYNNRGIVLASTGNIFAALNDFNKAIQLYPGYSEAYFNRGLMYHRTFKPLLIDEQEGYRKAMENYSMAISINSTYINAYSNRAMVYVFQEKYTSAFKDFSKILELDPNQAEAYFNRGLVKNMIGDSDGANKDFRNATELEPQFKKRLIQLGL